MHLHSQPHGSDRDDYLVSRPQAWFAFAMTFALMLFDYIDRQVIVSLFPHIKLAWGLSDKQLGGLVSIISVVVAVGSLPVALLADRFSRVKSICVMACIWSVATIACMFTRNYGQMFAARAMIGVGETGYGSVGAALIASLFPKRLRSMLLGAFLAAAALGSVLGVMLGGVIAARWGWRAAFGVVGVPGLLLAVLYLLVPDYKTVALVPRQAHANPLQSARQFLQHVGAALSSSRTVWWTCFGAAFQLIVVSSVWAWLPSYFNRFHGLDPHAAAKEAALIVLCSALGNLVWGFVVDRLAMRRPRNKLIAVAVLCTLTLLVFLTAFLGAHGPSQQFTLIALGGFLMTCSVGPAVSVVLDVIHPGVRSTGAAMLTVFQNLFGLAIGPFVGGVVSDAWGLQTALTVMPAFGLLAAVCFLVAQRSYEGDLRRVAGVQMDVADTLPAPATAPT